MVKVHSVHRKWTIQSEADKKLVTGIVGFFSQGKMRRLKKAQKPHNSGPEMRIASCHQSCISDQKTNLENRPHIQVNTLS